MELKALSLGYTNSGFILENETAEGEDEISAKPAEQVLIYGKIKCIACKSKEGYIVRFLEGEAEDRAYVVDINLIDIKKGEGHELVSRLSK